MFDLMQQVINTQTEYLITTKEVIRPNKFLIYLIVFRFDNTDRYYFEKVESFRYSLIVRNEENIREVLDLTKVDTETNTLGIYLVPDKLIKNKIEHLL